jgi:hypothetical protein
MTALFIFLIVIFWMVMVFIGSNQSVAIKTGLLKSRYRDEYIKQHHTYASLVRVLAIKVRNISNYENFITPFGFKLKYYLFYPNAERVCTDMLLVAAYYLKSFEPKGIRISLDYNTANDIHAVLNMVMANARLFRKVFNQPTYTSQEELAVRFLILKRVCQLNKVHSIEWMYIEPVIRNTFRTSPMLRHTYGVEALASLLDKELSYLGEERLRNGLAIAMKALCYTHPVYRNDLHSTVLSRVTTLRMSKFKETMLFEMMVKDFTLFDMAKFNFEEVTGLLLTKNVEEFKPLIFDCDNYLIMPSMNRKNVSIYTYLPMSLLTVLTALNDLGYDTNSWVVDYFLTHDTGYIVWDTLNPGLEPEKRKVNLGKETWGEDRRTIHSHFKSCMDGVFNVSSK